MMLLVLLLRPPDRIIEAVEIRLPPSTDRDACPVVTVGEVLNVLVPSHASHPALRRQVHTGLYRYRFLGTPSHASRDAADGDGSFGDVLTDPGAAAAVPRREGLILLAVWSSPTRAFAPRRRAGRPRR